MKPILYAHPFSSYCQKVLIAFYANDVDFDYRMIETAGVMDELAALWPLRKFPVMVDAGRTTIETSVIIEQVQLSRGGPAPMLPSDPQAALEVRMLDRIFDNYVMTAMQEIVNDALRPEGQGDPYGAEQGRHGLDRIYAWLDERMATRQWACGDAFTLADCAAAPALFYADWAHGIDARFAHLRDYRARLLAYPAFARAVEEARPFRSYFPLGAPDRD